ncbi:MAG: response regulator [Acidobacteria bacterium]|nr:response regulator [Acidobacteriota bacterium]
MDLAVVDLNLPRNSGIEVLEAIRRNQRLSQVPVVIATSSASPGERARTEQLGVDLFITKPSDLESFLYVGLVLGSGAFRPLGRPECAGSK